ncbi:MAG TPA: hypothetical protein VN255_02265 [Mycobacterium sp.]|nr:hypothetical protein [Mycobacterium sp.]HWT47440.1 hypothetical protein [Mycobacterium sp.]
MDSTNARDRIEAVFDKLEVAQRRFSELSFDALTASELWELLDRFESINGKLAALKYELTNPFARHADAGPSAERHDRAPGKRDYK